MTQLRRWLGFFSAVIVGGAILAATVQPDPPPVPPKPAVQIRSGIFVRSGKNQLAYGAEASASFFRLVRVRLSLGIVVGGKLPRVAIVCETDAKRVSVRKRLSWTT